MSKRDKLRILAVHRYFWPDTAPYGTVLHRIAHRWADDGHEVEILATQPSYKAGADMPRLGRIEHENERLRVRRLTLFDERGRHTIVQLINVFIWLCAIFIYGVSRKRFDVIMVATHPPVVAAMAARFAAKVRNSKLIYHCMDIHPEIGRISGDFRRPVVYERLRRIDQKTCRAADRIIVLSTDMREALENRPNAGNLPIEVIHNFDVSENDSTVAPLPDGFALDHRGLRVIFAGNIGRFQGLESVIDALRMLGSDADVELVLVGAGSAAAELIERSGTMLGETIFFYRHQPTSVVRQMLRSSDLGLVCLNPGISRYAFPHKTMTYLSEALPLLACVEQDSELSELVTSYGIGRSVPPANSAAIVDALIELSTSPSLLAQIRGRTAEISLELFREEDILRQWSSLIDTL